MLLSKSAGPSCSALQSFVPVIQSFLESFGSTASSVDDGDAETNSRQQTANTFAYLCQVGFDHEGARAVLSPAPVFICYLQTVQVQVQ